MVAAEQSPTSTSTTDTASITNINNNQGVHSPSASGSSALSVSLLSATTTKKSFGVDSPTNIEKTENIATFFNRSPSDSTLSEHLNEMSSVNEFKEMVNQPTRSEDVNDCIISTQTISSSNSTTIKSNDMGMENKFSAENNPSQVSKKSLKLDLTTKEINDHSGKSSKSPQTGRLSHQVSLTSSVDVEDRKTLREVLYQGIFYRHRKTIFAMGSFLRMLRSRNSSYNTIRSSSEGDDIDDVR